MKLQLSELSTEQEKELQWEIPQSWVEDLLQKDSAHDALEASLFVPQGSLLLKSWLYRNTEEVFFRSHLFGEFRFICVRCLREDNPLSLSIEFHGIFRPQNADDIDEAEDAAYFFFTNDEIDFSLPVSEHLFLNLPLNPSCTEKDCSQPNHSTQFMNASEEKEKLDPRWKALRHLLDKNVSN